MTTTVPPVNGAAAACSPHPKPGARKGGPAETASAGGKPKAATYDYTDEAGKLLFQVVRHYQGKDFDQRRPDGSGGWIWNLDGVRSVLYRLPDIRQDDFQPVFIAEREQDADALHKKMDLLATTNPGGATHGKWLPEYSKMLAGRDVMILPNNHEAGRKWAQSVAASLEPKAPMLKVVQLPGLPEGGTVSDWLAVRGNGMNSLSELVGEASEWRPSPAPTTRKTQTKSPPPPAHQVEAYKPFPIETLPAVIQDYVSQVAKALGCDPAYVALPTLAVVASA
ncbi:MAG TPA: hypothetical protein VEL76_30130, partial [Gemmataceae bacterium]|nr:hypothetical protein [Gemmataceae bacterium]